MSSNVKREAIMDAFMAMIEEMPLESIRIEELIVRAKVSKSTFIGFFKINMM